MLISEKDRLVAALYEHGIHFLVGGEGIPAALARISSLDIIIALAADPDPRLRLALTSLFLLHPEYAQEVRRALGSLDGTARLELQARYMAAVYLQRMWRTRLGYYLSDFQLLPDLFSAELGLPKPDERFGKTGLLALAEWHSRQSPIPFNRLASYNKAADLLFGQLRAEAHRHELATAG